MLLTPGVDMTTGSLGQGASAAVGLALAQKMDDKKSRTFLFLGDGECNEGQVWEAVMFANQHKLGNLTAFVDNNSKQLDGTTAEIMNMGDIAAKFTSFGWHAQTVDGGDAAAILKSLETAANITDKPSCIVLTTTKGAKVPTIEKIEYNHHLPLEGEMLAAALAECEVMLKELGGSV
jgi:transketolase